MSAILETLSAAKAAPLDLTPLAGPIGAEVRGIRLAGSLQRETFAAIKRALLKHRVLFFRGQQHLDDTEHEAEHRGEGH